MTSIPVAASTPSNALQAYERGLFPEGNSPPENAAHPLPEFSRKKV